MKKILKWVGIGICAFIVLLLAGLTILGGTMVKNAVNTFGPTVIGVPVTLEKASFMPLAGKIKLTKLHVGNPEGFKTPALFELDEVDIQLDVTSLTKNIIVIHRIAVIAPHITYERGLFDSNFGALTKQLEGKTEKKPEETATNEEAQESGKKVVIDELIITDPVLNMSLTATGGKAIPLKLGKVELKDIGKERGGVTFVDAMEIIFSVITSNIENVVLGAGNLFKPSAKAVGGGAKVIGSGAKTVGDTLGKGASSLTKGLNSLLGNPNTNTKTSNE